MPIKTRLILLIILTLCLQEIFSQNNSFFSDSIRARELNRTANILGMNGLHQQALDTFFLSLELRKALYGEESFQHAAVYSGIGITYRALGQYNLALENFNLAEHNYIKSGRFSNSQKTRLYTNIGNVYRSKLDYNRALEYFNQSLSITQSEPDPDVEEIASINYSISEIYYLIFVK